MIVYPPRSFQHTSFSTDGRFAAVFDQNIIANGARFYMPCTFDNTTSASPNPVSIARFIVAKFWLSDTKNDGVLPATFAQPTKSPDFSTVFSSSSPSPSFDMIFPKVNPFSILIGIFDATGFAPAFPILTQYQISAFLEE